jgi:hypothetical protein
MGHGPLVLRTSAGGRIEAVATSGGNQSVTLLNSDGVELAIDGLSGSILQSTYSHHEIHDGVFWTKVQTVSVVATESAYLAIKSGATKRPHALFSASANAGPITFQICTNPTVTAQGTTKTADNANHSESTAATAVVSVAPTVTVDGECIHKQYVGSKNATSAIRISDEVIPALEGYAVCKVTNDHNATQDIVISVSWYEKTPLA